MNREEAKNKVMTIYGSLSEDMKQAIDVLVEEKAEGIKIPEGATNGEVIKALFPDVSLEYRIWHDNLYFKDTDWWSAPYKQEEQG